MRARRRPNIGIWVDVYPGKCVRQLGPAAHDIYLNGPVPIGRFAFMSKKFRNALKKMNKAWKKTEPAAFGSNVNLDIDGDFEEMILRKAEIVERGKGLMVAWTWEFPELEGKKGAHSGKKYKKAPQVTVHTGLETDKNLAFLKKDLGVLLPEVELDELDLADDLEQLLKELTTNQPTCSGRVGISDDKQWQNVWPNELADGGSGDDEDEDEDEDEDSDEDEDEDDDSDSDDDEDDDEDEDEKPAKRGKKGGKKSEKEEDEDDEEEEEDDDEDEDSEEDEEEDEDEEPEIEKGSKVLYTPPKGKKQLEYTVIKVDAKKKTAILKDSKGKKLDAPVKLKVLELVAEEEEDFGKLEKGTKVEAMIDDKPYEGEIVSTDQKTETCKVKITSKGKLKGKVKSCAVEDVEILD